MTERAIAPGLDLFVAAWLERWHSFHGTVFLELATGKISTGFPMPGEGGRPHIEGEGYKRHWTDGFEHGRIRELDDLLRLVTCSPDCYQSEVESRSFMMVV